MNSRAALRGIELASALQFMHALPAHAQPASVEAEQPASANSEPSSEIVVGGRAAPRDVSLTELLAARARSLPGTQGDPLAALAGVPGAARQPIGAEGWTLWGASVDATKSYVDGVEIPSLQHHAGLRSTLAGDLVGSVALSPGAYGVEYGRGIGGIARVSTRRLPDAPSAALDLNVLDGTAFVSSPVWVNAEGLGARLALAGRYGWTGRVLHAVEPNQHNALFAAPQFADVQVKSEFELPNGTLDVVALRADDTTNYRFAAGQRSRSLDRERGFERLYARYVGGASDGSQLELVPWVGREASVEDWDFGTTRTRLDESAMSWGLRARQRLHYERVSFAVGLDLAARHSRVQREGSLTLPAREGDIGAFGQTPADETNWDAWRALALDVGPHLELDWQLGPLRVTPGVRVDGYLLETSRRTPRVGRTPSIGLTRFVAEIQPRLQARLALSRRVAFLLALGRYTQPPAAADLSAVFGAPELGVQTAYHVALGESVQFSEALGLSVLGFYESMQDLTLRDAAPAPKLAAALRDDGKGRSYGAQLSLALRPVNGWSGSVAHTFSRSERRSADGGWRLFDRDQPHVFTLVVSRALAHWTFGTRLRFASGAPDTPVVGAVFDLKDNLHSPLFGSQNSQRLPNFWQLDLRVDRRFELGAEVDVALYVEGLNITQQRNVEAHAYSLDYTERQAISGLPSMVVFGARLER